MLFIENFRACQLKLLDAFLFFNESELVLCRLAHLSKCVNHFLVIELGITHAGISREPIFPALYTKLSPELSKKVRYVFVSYQDVLDDLGQSSETIGLVDRWKIENLHRSYIDREAPKLRGWTHIVVSDADEVPSRAALTYLSRHTPHQPTALSQVMYQYNLQSVEVGPWRGSVISPRLHFSRRGAQWLRNRRAHFNVVTPAGWHFSSFGGSDRVAIKAANLAHSELSVISQNPGEISRRIAQRESLYDVDPFPSKIVPNSKVSNELKEFCTGADIEKSGNFYGLDVHDCQTEIDIAVELKKTSLWNRIRIFVWCLYEKHPFKFTVKG